MVKKTFSFTYAAVEYYFEGSFSGLKTITEPKKTILITDENVITRHQTKFKGWKTVTIKAAKRLRCRQLSTPLLAN
jgi:3-dehydroquinate synthase